MRNGYAHMVLDDYVAKVREIERARRERLRRIKTRAQALKYQETVKEAIRKAFRPRPRKTPLNARTKGVLQRPTYDIEKVQFESRPGFFVTGNLYVPRIRKEQCPGVVAPCGHSEKGKSEELYQAFCQRLAHSGFVVLIYDPINQGERDQYYGLPENEAVRGCCNAHNMMGKQLELVGDFFGMWRVWDGVRALDYLITRPEVDPSRLGVTGNSGGGTLATWLWAVEPRFTMVAPSCFITTFLANLENELPADCEQYPPGIVGAGLEMIDLMIARAPKPAILLGQRYDYFDRRGLQTAYRELRRFYTTLGAGRNVDCFIGPSGHGYSRHNQEAMVSFFAKHAGVKEVEFDSTEMLDDTALNVTPKGNVVAAGSTPIYKLIARQADRLVANWKRLETEILKKRLMALLNINRRRPPPHYRVLRPVHADRGTIARYAIETEGQIRAILRKQLTSPQYPYTLNVECEVNLYLPHTSAEEDMAEDPLAISLETSHPLYALDVRGLGESMPEEARRSGFFHSYGMDYMFHGHGILLGQSYLGRRVHDVLCTIALLGHEGARNVHVYGRGQGAILALFTSLLHPKVQSVVLKNGPISYLSWVQTPIVTWPAANFLRSALKTFDLPDCIRALGKKVKLLEPWGPDMTPLSETDLAKAMKNAELPLSLLTKI